MTARRFGGFSSLLGVITVVAVVVTAVGIFPFRQILEQHDAVDSAEERLDAVRAENRLLEEEIVALRTPQGVERLAREQFGLVRPGEVAYIVDISEGAATPPLAPPPMLIRDGRPWWESVWDWMTGEDLVQDG